MTAVTVLFVWKEFSYEDRQQMASYRDGYGIVYGEYTIADSQSVIYKRYL